MIANETPMVAHSLWTATAQPTPPCPPLQGATRADVAVVGGGFTGLSAALHLAERGIAVTLLEAESPGWGASGRNGGQVIPGLKHDPDWIERRFGAEVGGRMIRLSGGAADLVFDLIDRHGIECDAERKGWIQPAADAESLATARDRVAQWERRGAPIRFLDRTEAARLLGTDAYAGGLVDERGGAVHPLNYALGLAAAARRAGATLHGGSRVLRLERRPDGWRLHTPLGSVDAGHVLVCTNGYTDGIDDRLRRTVVPVRSVQVATQPISDNLRRSIRPEGQTASDSRRLLVYFRFDAAGRFVIGGRGDYDERGAADKQARLRRATLQLFPQLGEVEWAYHWGGFVALTRDHLPHLNELYPGVTAGLGYNGRGVAMATAMGRVLADRAMGVPDPELDFPLTRVAPIPFHRLRKPTVRLLIAWAALRDRWAAR